MLQVTSPYPRVPPPPSWIIMVEKNTKKHSVQEDYFLCLKTQPLLFQKCRLPIRTSPLTKTQFYPLLLSCFLLGFKNSKEASLKVE